MTLLRSICIVVLLSSLFTSLLGEHAALADIIVMKSNVAGIQEGDTYPDNKRFKISKGQFIVVLKKPASSTHRLKGPYAGTLAEYERKTCPWYKALVGGCKGHPIDTGGIAGSPETEKPKIGGNRGMKPK